MSLATSKVYSSLCFCLFSVSCARENLQTQNLREFPASAALPRSSSFNAIFIEIVLRACNISKMCWSFGYFSIYVFPGSNRLYRSSKKPDTKTCSGLSWTKIILAHFLKWINNCQSRNTAIDDSLLTQFYI